jgi:hypothetical protein
MSSRLKAHVSKLKLQDQRSAFAAKRNVQEFEYEMQMQTKRARFLGEMLKT